MSLPKSTQAIIKNMNINEYQLVNLVNKRVRELMHGAKPLIDDKKDNIIEITISEILSGKIKPNLPGK